ncbi:hypothetical protein MCHLDSM_01097 [Mycolicibacterium chlorophenolicum]|uniref:Uncharacterized protein n=1 Tax=Mycolicibacterium chlorophenolicum TaxID=37916 RepID=A0A0J6WIP5_9MYCO|nr:hypothetical protein MCHLDSM_01097 [Mycolicibacterium chlorophenolicum]
MNRERAPRGSQWVRAAAFVVLVASAVGAAAFLITAPSADCRAVRATVSYIHEHRDLISDDQIDAGPPLSDYLAWADTLQRHAESTSSPSVRSELARIAERARHAMGMVALARDNPAPSASASQRGIAGGFAADVSNIVDTEHRVMAACHFE